jgi:RHS repeat-associated protein
VATYQSNAFGRLINTTGTLDQPYQFSTKRYDAGTGLSYYGYRFYAPVIERWLNRDPLGEDGGINLYGFVGADPINRYDPTGLTETDGSELSEEPFSSNPQYEQCVADCIEKNRLDWAALAAAAGSELPKKMLPPFRVVNQNQRTTTVSSELSHAINRMTKPRKTGFSKGLRTFGRGLSRFATSLFLAEGAYDWGVILYCADKCREDPCQN